MALVDLLKKVAVQATPVDTSVQTVASIPVSNQNNNQNIISNVTKPTLQNSSSVFSTAYDTNERYGQVSDEEMKKRETYCAKDWAFELQKNGDGLFDSRIMDNAGLVEKNLIQNEEWRVDMGSDLNGDGEVTDDELESVALVDAIVDSYDSELDLYIEDKLHNIIETYGPSCNYNLRAIFGSPDSQAIKELARLGIRADAVGDHDNWQNRTYTFSLVDTSELPENATDEEILAHVYADDAQILQDANGNKGSIIFADCLTADGTAQGAEMNLSSILDQMGYECVSKADFIGKKGEYDKLLSDIDSALGNNEFTSSGETINDKYGETLKMYEAVCAVYNINADAPGQWGLHRTFEQTKNAVEAMGDRLFVGGCAKKGDAIDYGTIESNEEFDEFDVNKDSILDEEEIEEFKKKKGKNIGKIEQETQKELSNKNQIDMNDVMKDAVDEFYQTIKDANKKGETYDEQELIKEIAKKYKVDEFDLKRTV